MSFTAIGITLSVIAAFVALFFVVIKKRKEPAPTYYDGPIDPAPVSGDSTPSAPSTSGPVKPSPRSTNGLDFDTVPSEKYPTLRDVMLRVGRPFTPDEYTYLCDARGMQWPVEKAPEPGIDRSGFDLGTGGGGVKVNAGRSAYRFVVNPGTTRVRLDVFGVPGGFFRAIRYRVTAAAGEAIFVGGDTGVGSQGTSVELHNLPPGDYYFEPVVGEAGSLGVHYQQWAGSQANW